MEEITIRLMEKRDKQAVSEFFDNLDEVAKRFFDINGANRRVTMRFFDDADTDARRRYVAMENGKMIGYVYLRDVDTMIPWLGIASVPEARGKHLGTKMLQTVIDWAKSAGKGGILLTTHKENFTAQHLYEKCGFKRLAVCEEIDEYLYLLRF
ncbi:MAG: GNAT family N-acetyltransferase [Clostridia bacterium]|nr:GNAT family N-acetyltransferase [Clostridia bacterium]